MACYSRSLIACAPLSCITGAVAVVGEEYSNVLFGGETVFANNMATDYGGTSGSGAAKGIYVA